SLFSFIMLSALASSITFVNPASAQEENEGEQEEQNIPDVNAAIGDETATIRDPNLNIETVAEGLEFPTTMAFLGTNDFLVLEKEKGTVQRIVNGKMLPEPILDVNVGASQERCMCGIAISTSTPGHTYIFLYFTETESADKEDVLQGNDPIGNRLYRYELVNDQLVNPKLLLDLPATPGPRHNGGAVVIGPDNNLYIPIGDIDGTYQSEESETLAQNFPDGVEPDGRSGILRITQDGNQVPNGGIIGDETPLSLYYAYGIRNSFGINFDPVTGNLWDTENGPGESDEVNLVEPGFNSGWAQVQGMSASSSNNNDQDFNSGNLVDFDGRGTYSEPEFEWRTTLGPTALLFLHSDRLGSQYQNDIFIGSIVTGNIYRFDLNEDRTQLILAGELEDKIAETRETGTEDIVFGKGFAGISDLEVGPDGYLYVVSLGQGKIFRIVPAGSDAPTLSSPPSAEETI
ncbi:MAG TPA: PQQ-dependent sugar dehydrogenase, partial [Nitrososphaeraceae archaeon]|nr:PQQ-dependent sugar dehydrogenase [Nitrososphaeraceae archaeon]